MENRHLTTIGIGLLFLFSCHKPSNNITPFQRNPNLYLLYSDFRVDFKDLVATDNKLYFVESKYDSVWHKYQEAIASINLTDSSFNIIYDSAVSSFDYSNGIFAVLYPETTSYEREVFIFDSTFNKIASLRHREGRYYFSLRLGWNAQYLLIRSGMNILRWNFPTDTLDTIYQWYTGSSDFTLAPEDSFIFWDYWEKGFLYNFNRRILKQFELLDNSGSPCINPQYPGIVAFTSSSGNVFLFDLNTQKFDSIDVRPYEDCVIFTAPVWSVTGKDLFISVSRTNGYDEIWVFKNIID
jgi:hypothetical protein